MGLSISLDTGVTALRAAQMQIDTTAHNIANANTDGYSRQEVMLQAVAPPRAGALPSQQIGLGVDVTQVRRLRDGLLDLQYRGAKSLHDDYQAQADALQRVETTLNEPSANGLQAQLAKFFNSFRDLANQPESAGARAAAVEQGSSLAQQFNRLSTSLMQQRTDLDNAVGVKVTDINSKAQQIASLNDQIRIISLSGGTSNDLHDQRDLLLDQLAGEAGVTVQTQPNDTVDVLIGSRKLVDGTKTANQAVDLLKTAADPTNNNLQRVLFTSDSSVAPITTGDLHGTIIARDTNVTGMLNSLDGLANALITGVNNHHAAGYGLDNTTGLPFFTGTNSGTIAVNATLLANPQKLATSDAANEPGNANTANLIAGVQDELLANGGTSSIDDAYRSVVSQLGVASQQAQSQTTNQGVLSQHIEDTRQSVSGVSIDEEMTNLMKSQHAYQAAARVITTADSMLDTLINHTGVL